MTQTLDINGRDYRADVSPDMPLLWVLRDVLQLRGTKYGCGMGHCGACSVLLGDDAVRSCQVPVGAVGNRPVTTIEDRGSRELRALRHAWLLEDVAQCGYCQAGQLLSAAALLRRAGRPSDAEITEAMQGNLCRCGTYPRIVAAVRRAAATGGR